MKGSLFALTACLAFVTPEAAAADSLLERGDYLVRIGGCNDCHTPGYAESGGKTPKPEWLKGSTTGYRGPWGTSYPSNLRLTVAGVTEDQWLRVARARRLPPMPWLSLQAMSDQDLRAIYRFIQSLGTDGARAPTTLPPGAEASTPYIVLAPQNLPGRPLQ